jgi:hypothetical protein
MTEILLDDKNGFRDMHIQRHGLPHRPTANACEDFILCIWANFVESFVATK